MAKFLNVDALTPESRTLLINEVEHKMTEISVRDFVELIREEEEDEKRGEVTIAEKIIRLQAMIAKRFPTIPQDQLNAISFDKMNAIIAFIRDDAEKGSENEGEEKNEQSSGA